MISPLSDPHLIPTRSLHPDPKHIHPKVRAVISLLADSLFMVVCLRLLDALACDYTEDDGGGSTEGRLRVDPTMVCWQGEHTPLAALSLVGIR